MPRKLTEKDIYEQIKKVYDSGNLSTLYAQSYIKRKGETVDTGRIYQEIYAEYIFSQLEDCRIPGIAVAKKEYCKIARKEKEGTAEEKIQREFFYNKRPIESKLGECIWFELDIHRNGKGIDLVFFNKQNNELGIAELKCENENEPILRPILEIQTYYQITNWQKALDGLRRWNPDLPQYENVNIKKYIMVDKDSLTFKNYMEIKEKKDSYINKLIEAFQIEVILY